jgi:hypothetical protein
MIEELWTLRSMDHQVFRQIVERWEDDVSHILGLNMIDVSQYERHSQRKLGAVLRRVDPTGRFVDDCGRLRCRSVEVLALMFHIFAPNFGNYYAIQGESIPVVIDWWRNSLESGCRALSRCPVVVVTNSELPSELRSHGYRGEIIYCPLAVESAVLSLSPTKKVSLVQVGRRNQFLHCWAMDYVIANPSMEYLYADFSTGYPKWHSTKRGYIEVGSDRNSYLKLLGSARIALVSSPGIDGGEIRTGGFNPVTPRFYESAALGCQLVGRYPRDGIDFVANDVSSVCPHVESYSDFCEIVDAAINGQAVKAQVLRAFAERHSGEAMARRLRESLQSFGLSFST